MTSTITRRIILSIAVGAAVALMAVAVAGTFIQGEQIGTITVLGAITAWATWEVAR